MNRKNNGKTLVIICGGIEEMAGAEVIGRIGKNRYAMIRGRDPHPMFVEFLAGHEGVSTGSLKSGTGRGRPARKIWSREKVREIARKLGMGVPVFLFHSRGSRSRKPVGEVLSAAEQWVKGMLGATGVAYISDRVAREKIRTGEIDTCSIEAEVECHRMQKESDSWVVDAVRNITGIALGDSRRQRPGFPGAALLAAVEEFERDFENQDPLHGKTASGLSGRKPSEVYSREILLDDPVVEEMIRGCRERDAARIEELAARIEIKDKSITELSGELERFRAEENNRHMSLRAEQEAERALSGLNLSAEERRIIIGELRARPPREEQDFESRVKDRVREELDKMDRLRKTWNQERIASPPERGGSESPTLSNPLIPTPRQW